MNLREPISSIFCMEIDEYSFIFCPKYCKCSLSLVSGEWDCNIYKRSRGGSGCSLWQRNLREVLSLRRLSPDIVGCGLWCVVSPKSPDAFVEIRTGCVTVTLRLWRCVAVIRGISPILGGWVGRRLRVQCLKAKRLSLRVCCFWVPGSQRLIYYGYKCCRRVLQTVAKRILYLIPK